MRRTPRVMLGILGIVGVLLVPILVTAPGAQAAKITTTGNAKTISFYRAMIKKTRLYGGIVVQQSGYVALKSPAGKSWSAGWGEGTPAGYSPASEAIMIASKGGKVTWVTDKMTPQCSASVGPSGVSVSCGSNVPVETFLDASGKYATEYFSAGSCWSAGSKGSYVDGYTKIGVAAGYGLSGHFLPMKRVGRNELVTSTSQWGKGTATEIDTIRLATHLPIKTVVHYSTDGKYPAFTEDQVIHWLRTAPAQPQATVCAG